jgi:2-keto-4-pentenoate hydratase
MSEPKATAAAAILWRHWQQQTRIDGLPADCRPADRAEGYGVQSALARLSGQPIVGWKIAATSLAGQQHINVDGPLAAPLFANRVAQEPAAIPAFPLDGNIMRVAEAEFAFRFGRALPRRDVPYTKDEVLDAVESLHPGIEVPDSRYTAFTRVGAAQLIADLACACWYALGPATTADWRGRDLPSHPVNTYRNGTPAGSGTGANVLGDPRIALTWCVNELAAVGTGVAAGHFVTTGTCVVPPAVAPGDRFRADFGDLGAVEIDLR